MISNEEPRRVKKSPNHAITWCVSWSGHEVLNAAKSSNGYRLLVLNTNDRPLAMKVRSQLLENFPEQKVYMGFQPPFIKLKFGNFLTKEDAEAYKKDILKLKIISGNVYLLPETIELKPDKNKDKETIEN